MAASPETLVRYEWVEPTGSGVRFKFRREGTGFYEREGAPGTRLIRDNFLYKLEDSTLHLKFAHARQWTTVGVELSEGAAAAESRLGRFALALRHDPYARAIEDRPSAALSLVSDSGAALAE
jgi:hypothetical protein